MPTMIVHNKEVARQITGAIRNASNETATAKVRSCSVGVNLSGIGEAVSAHRGYGAVMARRAELSEEARAELSEEAYDTRFLLS